MCIYEPVPPKSPYFTQSVGSHPSKPSTSNKFSSFYFVEELKCRRLRIGKKNLPGNRSIGKRSIDFHPKSRARRMLNKIYAKIFPLPSVRMRLPVSSVNFHSLFRMCCHRITLLFGCGARVVEIQREHQNAYIQYASTYGIFVSLKVGTVIM